MIERLGRHHLHEQHHDDERGAAPEPEAGHRQGGQERDEQREHHGRSRDHEARRGRVTRRSRGRTRRGSCRASAAPGRAAGRPGCRRLRRNDVTTIQYTGKAKTSRITMPAPLTNQRDRTLVTPVAPVMSGPRCAASSAGSTMVRTSVMATMISAAAAPSAEVALADRHPVGPDAEQVGLAGDATRLLQHVDLGEHLQVPQRAQRGEDEDQRPERRQDDVAEPLASRTAPSMAAASSTSPGIWRHPGVHRERDERDAHPRDDDRGHEEERQRLGEPAVALRSRRRAG